MWFGSVNYAQIFWMQRHQQEESFTVTYVPIRKVLEDQR